MFFIYNKVLLAVDGSKDSMRATKEILEIKKKFRCKVVAFYSIENYNFPKIIMPAIPIPGNSGYNISQVDFIQRRTELKIEAIEILNETQKIFDSEDLSIETNIIINEKPEDYIERIVEEKNFDLVALGCRGNHSKLRRIFMGNVAQKVLNDASCDVLIVR
ncbi:MAG: universal stress protein [Candidatus Hodarchaeota archaeon]